MDRGNSNGPSSLNTDTNVTAPAVGNIPTLFPAEQYSSCPQAATMALSYNWSAMTTLVNSMSPNGNTNQGIGLALGWMSLVGGGPFPTPPPMDPLYKYQQVIILLTDGLNTQNRWYSNQSQIDTRQQLTCNNINAAGFTLYTIQVNTGGDPTSTLLQNCAGSPGKYPDSDKFFLLTSSSEIVTVFNQIGVSLSNLRVANKPRARTPTTKSPAERPGFFAICLRPITQSPAEWPGFHAAPWGHRSLRSRLLDRRDLAELTLERLVGFLGERGVELAKLGCLGDKALIRALGVVALHLDRLFQRLRADELLARRRALLEHFLRVVRDLDRDRLHALRQHAERLHRRIHIVLAELLHLVDVLDHVVTSPGRLADCVVTFPKAHCRADWSDFRSCGSALRTGTNGIYCDAQKCQALVCNAIWYPRPADDLTLSQLPSL